MTKLSGAEDVGFKRVSAKLHDWVSKLQKEQQQGDDGAYMALRMYT